jgi:putative hydrolase of the HAD superfamily
MRASNVVARAHLIIFDLFHTLVSFKSDGTPGESTSELLGIPEQAWNTLLWESSDYRLRQNHEDDATIIRQLAHFYDKTISDETIRLAAQARAKRFQDLLMNPPTDKLAVLDTLRQRGHSLILLSNADCMERRGWTMSPLSQRFHHAYFSCDTGVIKPEADAYATAMEAVSATPETTIFIGDGGSHELRGAKACGITTIMTTEIIGRYYPQLIAQRLADADYIIEHLSELIAP